MMNVQPATNANRTDLNFNINLNSKQEINLPKTFTTRLVYLYFFFKCSSRVNAITFKLFRLQTS